MTAQHTPGPWGHYERLSASENHRGYVLTAPTHKPSSRRIAIGELLPMDSDGNEGRANAEFIVRAVNSHELMVEALREAGTWISDHVPSMEAIPQWRELIGNLRAAIAAATGEDA